MNFFDLHCDTPSRCFKENLYFSDQSLAVTPKKAPFLNNWHQCFAVFIKDDTENPYCLYRRMLNNFKSQLKNRPSNLTPYFTLEGASLINCKEKVLVLKNDGIRAATLTWNGENNIAGGVNSDKGLTEFGKEILLELNKYKIFTDLSHLNQKSFFDIIDRSEYPIATHSNCRSLCDNKRNLTDEQIRLIAQKNGLIGLCFYPEFLNGDVFEAVYQNIYRLLDIGVEDNIAIGSDFDGGIMDEKLDGIDKIPALFRFLETKGIEKRILIKIFYQNALKYFDKTDTMI